MASDSRSDVSSNPRYLRRLAEQVDEFKRAFSKLLRLCEFTIELRVAAGPSLPADVLAGYASLPAVIRKAGVSDDEWVAAKARCSRAAGRIVHVPDITHVCIALPTGRQVNPFEVWVTVTQPNSLLQPDDVLAACDHAIGVLEAMAERVAVAGDISIEGMHPLVWGAARDQWNIELYREAVSAAVGALIDHVRQLTGRTDLDEKDVLVEAFSSSPPATAKPRLRWPGNERDQTVRSMNRGLLGYATGIQAAIRNPTTHDRTQLTAQHAGEYLAALSLMASWIDRCRTDSADEPGE